jgi:hypothetical protein
VIGHSPASLPSALSSSSCDLGVPDLEGVELNIGVAMSKPPDHGSYSFFASVCTELAHTPGHQEGSLPTPRRPQPLCRIHPRNVKPLPIISRPQTTRTSMYSQFSEVRFSSVALAGGGLAINQGRLASRDIPTTSSNAFCCARNIAAKSDSFEDIQVGT